MAMDRFAVAERDRDRQVAHRIRVAKIFLRRLARLLEPPGALHRLRFRRQPDFAHGVQGEHAHGRAGLDFQRAAGRERNIPGHEAAVGKFNGAGAFLRRRRPAAEQQGQTRDECEKFHV